MTLQNYSDPYRPRCFRIVSLRDKSESARSAGIVGQSWTLQRIRFWTVQRDAVLNMRRIYKAVVRAIMCSQDNWNIFAKFCEIMMKRKEKGECVR